MKIPLGKQVKFLKKMLSDTMRHGTGCWDRQMPDSVATLKVFGDVPLDREGIFSYRFPVEGSFWLAMGKNGRAMGAIGIDYGQMEPFDNNNEEIRTLLTRLFYLLFDCRPNANKIIDEFLSLDQVDDNTDANTQ